MSLTPCYRYRRVNIGLDIGMDSNIDIDIHTTNIQIQTHVDITVRNKDIDRDVCKEINMDIDMTKNLSV